MKHRRIHGWLSVALLAAAFWSGAPAQAEEIGTEVKIVPDQPQPSLAGIDLSKTHAVWVSQTDPDRAITLYHLEDKTESRIVANGSVKTFLKADGNVVAWIDGRHGGTDVYVYDITKQTERRLTNGSAVASELDVQGNYVVWTDKRGGKSDIYAYDLSKNEELRISQSGKASHPTVSNGNVAWQDQRNGNADIYYYNLSRRQEFAATTYRGDQKHPRIVGTQIVYEDSRNKYQDVYQYDISKRKEKRLTDDSDQQAYPQKYGDFVIYLEENDLKVYDLDDEGNSYIEHNIYEKLMPSIFGDYVLFAKQDEEKKPRLFLYNLDDEEMEPIGGINGEPTQPDGDSRYVVYLNKGREVNSVVLYDAVTRKLSAISDPETDPERPLVSNQYVVWYDDDAEALIAYDIRKGKAERVTGKDAEPVSDMYELSGNMLFWLDEGSSYNLNVTDLASGETEEVKSLRKQPTSIDIRDHYLVWVTDEGSNKGKIVLYDMEEQDETAIRKDKVQVDGARLGSNFVVWSEFVGDNWDLFYYDLESRKVRSVLRSAKRDQVHPQAAGDYIFFDDNRNSVKGQYFQELYNLAEGTFSDVLWSEDAVITEPRMGGNRLVWIDKRDRDRPIVYTMAFAEPEDEDNSGEGED